MLKKVVNIIAIMGILIPVLMLCFLVKESLSSLREYGLAAFLLEKRWFPLEGEVGLIYQIKGSVYCSFLALLLAAPSGVSFVFLTAFILPRKISFLLNLFCEVMMGIPSVIFGLWGLIEIVPLFAAGHPPGTNMLVGAIVLSMMIFPGIVVGTRGLLLNFNQHHSMSKISLGISDFNYFVRIFIAGNVRKMSTVFFVQLARALGETVAVLMVTGNVVQDPDSFFVSMRTLTSNIALEMAYAEKFHRSALFFSGLILAMILMFLTLAMQFIGKNHND